MLQARSVASRSLLIFEETAAFVVYRHPMLHLANGTSAAHKVCNRRSAMTVPCMRATVLRAAVVLHA